MRPPLRQRIAKATLPLAVLLACLLVVTPAEATWPGKNGAIAFWRSYEGGPGDIWIEQPSGRQRRLTFSGRSESSPVYSPDGGTIAFVSWNNDGSDIWLMDSNGTDKRMLVDIGRYDSEPHFLPSGRSLMFASSYAGGSRTFSIRTDGTGLQRWSANASDPTISADGRWLAYSRRRGDGEIVLEDLRTGSVRQLPSGVAYELDFSPDSSRLVYTGRRKCHAKGNPRYLVLTIGLRGEPPKPLVTSCGKRFVATGGAWSPDGKRIIVSRVEGLGSMPANHHMVMMTPGGTYLPGAPRSQPGFLVGDASWQPLP